MALGTSCRSQSQSSGGPTEVTAPEGRESEVIEACAGVRQKAMAASSWFHMSLRKAMLSETYWTGVLISWAMPAVSCPIAESFSFCMAIRRSLMSRAEMTLASISPRESRMKLP